MIADRSDNKNALTSGSLDPASSPRAAFLAGVRACGALIMGVIPFAMVCGAAAAAAGFDFHQSFGMSWLVFAGSSQIVATQLYSGGAPAWVVVATGVVVNLRFMMYSAALAPHLRDVTPLQRWLAAYLLTDQAFAVTVARAAEGRAGTTWFYFGIAGALWAFWQAATIAGIILGTLIPASWSLDFVVALTFISVMAPVMKDHSMAVAALCGGVASVLLDLPLKLNLIAAAFIGIASGMITRALWTPRFKSGE